jgi:heat shock protein HtpX
MGGLLGLLGWLLWGGGGVLALLFFGLLAVTLNPSVSPYWVMRLYGADRIDPRRAPGLRHAITVLSERAGLASPPSLYYLPSRVLNAFAVGSSERSAIALTDGLIRQLSDRELIGVLAHELSHIANRDLWVMGLADVFSRATRVMSLVGQFLLLLNLPLLLLGGATISWSAILLLILAPNLSALAQLALSRTREYHADLNAAYLTGDPQGLASALAKIERVQGTWIEQILLPGRQVPDPSLLRSHPRTEDRIDRLATLDANAAGYRIVVHPSDPFHLMDQRKVDRAPRWHLSGLWH